MRYLQDGTLAPKQQCALCDKYKTLADFHPDKGKKSGYHSYCRDCQNAKSSAWGRANLERKRIYRRQYYKAHQGQIRATNRAWSKAHQEQVRAAHKKWDEQHREYNRQKARNYGVRLREEVFAAYGGVCKCCGESMAAFLSIDHIDGGGSEHRRTAIKGHNTYAWLKRNGYPDGFQLLCYNCNQAKHMYGQCPHQKPS